MRFEISSIQIQAMNELFKENGLTPFSVTTYETVVGAFLETLSNPPELVPLVAIQRLQEEDIDAFLLNHNKVTSTNDYYATVVTGYLTSLRRAALATRSPHSTEVQISSLFGRLERLEEIIGDSDRVEKIKEDVLGLLGAMVTLVSMLRDKFANWDSNPHMEYTLQGLVSALKALKPDEEDNEDNGDD